MNSVIFLRSVRINPLRDSNLKYRFGVVTIWSGFTPFINSRGGDWIPLNCLYPITLN
jgi:hypothetical protein